MTLTLRHTTILPEGTCVLLTRATLTTARPKALHTHDFYEVFWVQNGTVRHHLPDGVTALTEGDLILLQPGDRHALQGRGTDAMIVSLCLHPDCVAGLIARHPGLWPRASQVHRSIPQRATLNQAALALENSACDQLATEAFLLPVLAALQGDPRLDAAPLWLQQAVVAAQTPDVMRAGAAGLVAQTGKAHAHVTRTMQRFLGTSPASYINGLRMARAARLLTGTSDPLAEIASDIGIPNLSHFHKQFRTHFGQTPAQYRAALQRDVVQPT